MLLTGLSQPRLMPTPRTPRERVGSGDKANPNPIYSGVRYANEVMIQVYTP